MTVFKERLEAVRRRIAAAASKSGRDPAEVRVLAVGKRHPAEAIRALAALGQRAFGENYVSEAAAKIEALADLDLEWHYIGPVQSNKTAAIANHFHWVQSVDREKILRRLSAQRPGGMAPLQCCLQVRIGDEETKSGAAAGEVPALAALAASLPGIRLRGLMAIPPPSDEFAVQRGYFAELRLLYERLKAAGFELDTLSMGMSGDLEAAIAEGASLVRIGTALFGPRLRNL